LALAALLPWAAACSDDPDDLPPADWAAEVCATGEKAHAQAIEVRSALTGPADADDLRAMIEAQRELLAELDEAVERAGAPDVEGGAGYARALRDAIEAEREELADANEGLEEEPPVRPKPDVLAFEGGFAEALAGGEDGARLRSAIERHADCAAYLLRPADERTPETEGDTTEEWARGVCVAFDGWSAEVEALAEEAEAQPVPPDTAAARDAAIGFVDELLGTTNDLVIELRGLPAPDVEDGEAIAGAVVEVAAGIRETLLETRGELEAVDPDDREAFLAALGDVREALTGAQAEADEGLAGIAAAYDTAELSSILSRVPECAAPDSP
jgi:hypothetical protein